MYLRFINKVVIALSNRIYFVFSWLVTFMKFKLNGVQFSGDFSAKGIPLVHVDLKGKVIIGAGFVFHSGPYFNMIGRQQRCYFVVGKDAVLQIGRGVGISSTAIVCKNSIKIGDDVKIGGGVVIYDTDFHSLSYLDRRAVPERLDRVRSKPVVIEDNVFIGAHSIVLKGVVIGRNSVVGAGSVVSKSIPENEIWAGNPCRFVRKLNAPD